MGNFLKNLINNAANSVTEGIKKRVDDGTFNRLASDFGNDVNSLAAGMVSIVGMAEKTFSKLKNKASDAKTHFDERAERLQAEKEQREHEAAEKRAAQLAAIEQEHARQQSDNNDDDKYVPGVEPVDDYIARLANVFYLDDEDITCYGMTRLTLKVGLFFANCDGNYTARERQCIEDFKEMVAEHMSGFEMEDDNGQTLEFHPYDLFDDIDQPSTIADIIQMTHRLVDGMSADDRKSTLEALDYLASQIVEADVRDDETTEVYYDDWRREFGL